MAFAALPSAFFLDDPQDGVSYHLLTEAGVDLKRKCDAGKVPEANRAVFGLGLHEPSDKEATKAVLQNLLQAEHSFEVPTSLFAVGGSIAVDVRDSVDAWFRVVLEEGDGISFAANTQHRLVAPGTQIVTMPDFPADCDRESKLTTVRFAARAKQIEKWGSADLKIAAASAASAGPALAVYKQRFAPGSPEEAAANVPHFQKPGTPHTRDTVVELCASFYHLGWVTGTGGSISIRHGSRIFMAPSSVQKERMQRQDIYCLDSKGQILYQPQPLPAKGKRQLSLSQCAPLFQHAFNLRKAGACIHTHDVSAVLATLQVPTSGPHASEWRVTHQEMIKGIQGHGFEDDCVVPVIENTPHECDLADSLGEAMERYPRSNAVLVRRHGVYVWGSNWEHAKTQAECYHYLFDLSVKMRGIGVDPSIVPQRVENGIGSSTSYGSGKAGAGGGAAATPALSSSSFSSSATATAPCACSCCGHSGTAAVSAAAASTPAPVAAAAPAPAAPPSSTTAGAVGSGFHGIAGASSAAASASAAAESPITPLPLDWSKVEAVVLDIEGTTTPISFVTDVLFPFAATHLEGYLRSNWGKALLVDDVKALVALSKEDVSKGVMGATAVSLSDAAVAAVSDASAASETKEAVIRSIKANVDAQMAINRKTAALKQLQAHIWRDGYSSGSLKGQVFADVPLAFQQWTDNNSSSTNGPKSRKVYIYSSGSREAQRLLFASVAGYGDLRPHLSGFFDIPSSGFKHEASSYESIRETIGVEDASKILFATDALVEAVAACRAGYQVVITDRPGNNPLPKNHGFPVVNTLLEIPSYATAGGASS